MLWDWWRLGSGYNMAQYGKLEYWDERYGRETEQFDWYQRWTGVRSVFCQYIVPSHRILQIGCGNSKLAEDMYEDGFLSSVNIDFSQTVIKTMQDRYKNIDSLRFIHMDARKMQFEDSTFDAVIDKGTLDSILCSENAYKQSFEYLSEVYRVLNSEGVYLMVSYGRPPQRLPYLERTEFDWDVTVTEIPKPSIPSDTNENQESIGVHLIYLCKKCSS